MNALVGVTQRYLDQPLVVGNDLRNEIRYDSTLDLTPTWGDSNPETDWRMAATAAGNKILQVNPNQLIIVEGLDYALDFEPIKSFPMMLSLPNRLVYSSHWYGWDLDYNMTYDEFKQFFDETYSFMMLNDEYPLWLGEFGANTSDAYWTYLIRYMAENPNLHWAYWSYNGYKYDPEEDETYGITNADMVTVRDDWKLSDLQSVNSFDSCAKRAAEYQIFEDVFLQ